MYNQFNLIDWVLASRWRSHVLYWLVILFSYPLLIQNSNLSFYEAFIEKLFYLPPQMLATYFFLYYQLPQLIFKKLYGAFVLSFLGATYILGVMAHALSDYCIKPLLQRDGEVYTALEILLDIGTVLYNSQWIYLVAWGSAGIKLIKQGYENQQQSIQLEKEKATAELNYLKAQIHPRLLANTLDNLYELSLQKSDEAPEVVIKLSEMLDYMLYQTEDGPVLITKELEVVEHFLTLEKLRFPNNFDWEIQNELKSASAKIAPMLLITLVEHLLNKRPQSAPPQKIDLLLKETKGKIQIQILLSWKEIGTEQINNPNTSSFETLKKQLDLIYSDQYQLKIEKHSHQHILNVWLPLENQEGNQLLTPKQTLTYE